MANILTIQDFTDYYKISNNKYTESKLQNILDQFEARYLCLLFGETMRDLFVADLDTMIPQDPLYLKIYNPLCLEDGMCACGNVNLNYSEGLKDTMLGLIYYHYVTSQQYKHTLSGLVNHRTEGDTNVNGYEAHSIGELRYNQAVDNWKVIREYIIANKEDYPDYKGSDLDYKYNGLF